MTKLLNTVLLVLLAFIVGLYSGAHPDRLVTAYHYFYPPPTAPQQKLSLSSSCGCSSCSGHCGDGRGACQCDPLECMDKNGCFANCPGK